MYNFFIIIIENIQKATHNEKNSMLKVVIDRQ